MKQERQTTMSRPHWTGTKWSFAKRKEPVPMVESPAQTTVPDQQARIKELEGALRSLFGWADEYVEDARAWPSVRRAGLALGMERWW